MFKYKRHASLSDPQGVYFFPWGGYLIFSVCILLFFWGIGLWMYFSGEVDQDFLFPFLIVSTLVCTTLIVVGLVGRSRRKKVREELKKGRRWDQIRL